MNIDGIHNAETDHSFPDQKDDTMTAFKSLSHVLSNKPENFFYELLILSPDREGDQTSFIDHQSRHVTALREISRKLFKSLEILATCYHQQQAKSEHTKSIQESYIGSLSGVSDLILEYDKGTDDTPSPLDAETIWGQIDLQNTALMTLASKSIRRMNKLLRNSLNDPNILRLLDLSVLQSEGVEDDVNELLEQSEQSSEEDSDDNDDSTTRRMHLRMQRAMDDDTSDDEENQSHESSNHPTYGKKDDAQEDIFDPAAQELDDGFFDLHDAEAFADEEEDMILDNDYSNMDDEMGSDESDTLMDAKKSLKQSQKKKEMDESKKKMDYSRSRKRYRDDDDVEALLELYKDSEEASDYDINEQEEFNTLTADDYFGPPKKRNYEIKNSTKQIHHSSGTNWNENSEEDSNYTMMNESDSLVSVSQSIINKPNGKVHDKSSKLLLQTEMLEKELLAEKPWSLHGESKGTDRPVNSLLEITPEFEFATKMAPVITEEHTVSIEDMIIKRILAEDWDDVVPRELPDVGWSKRKSEKPEVSQEKSKLSLGELYEREYLKKVVGHDVDAMEKQSEEEKAKSEIRMLFANLCSRLDALSNYHFAPRPIADEAEVKTVSTPAIAMEEVLPLHVSNSRVSAPEEIFASKQGRNGILRGDSEMDQAERKRLRQSKKTARRKARQAKLADEKLISRLQPGLGLNNPYEKRKLREELHQARVSGKLKSSEHNDTNDFKSSTSFFQKIQANIMESKRNK